MSTYQISELAERSGVPATTLRFYEQAGLLPARRSPSGYRRYDDDDVRRLAFISSGKSLGLPLAEIRDLLVVWEQGECGGVRDRLRPLVAGRIEDADRRVAELSAFIASLIKVAERLAEPAPAGDCGSDCGCLIAPPTDAPVVCTLSEDELGIRAEDWRELLTTVTDREPIQGGLRLTLPTEHAARVAELAVAEQGCCAFFDFTIRLGTNALVLDVRAPATAADLVASLFGAPA
ncbi:MAG TPA: MerR family transcriptional regulator [Pseudonocardiaceae bacterium]|nr:MerR family transcriptional regulator [Pseudonocardiaceae bacterium]